MIFHIIFAEIWAPDRCRAAGPVSGQDFGRPRLQTALSPRPDGVGGAAGAWNHHKTTIGDGLTTPGCPRTILEVPPTRVTFFSSNPNWAPGIQGLTW